MIKTKKLGEEGFAPIIVSIIIVIVLSLLTVGFVTLANNSAQNALNRQLSNNAYYAADSGVNDAIAAITHGYLKAKTT
ncbi:MAG: PilX N-terminal domain-containing pilus assembly protein, partial [Candidatus Saccharimonadales bacterium]